MSICKLALNLDEISNDVLAKISNLNKIINIKPPNVKLDPTMQKLLEEILKKLPDFSSMEDFKTNINQLTDIFSHLGEIKGEFRIDGSYLNIPAIINNYPITFTYDYDLYLIGVDFSLTGWKKEDTWSLMIDDKIAFDKVNTKEIGDRKYFQLPYLIKAGSLIKIVLNNNSGNSRQMWSDLYYVKSDSNHVLVKCIDENNNILKQYYVEITGTEQTIQAPDIKNYIISSSSSVTKTFNKDEVVIFTYNVVHPWRIKVEMQWEKKCNIDLDIYGYIDNQKVYFGNQQGIDIWLDKDIKQHITNDDPEILTCNKTTGILKIGVNKFAGNELTQDVIFTIKKIDSNNKDIEDIIKIIYVKVKLSKDYIYYVCDIDMNTLNVTEINNKSTIN